MEPEDIILIIAIVLVVVDIILFTRRGGTRRGLGIVLSALGFAMFVAYYILFIKAFYISDFSIQQVYDYSSSSLPLTLKLFASWGGSSGSLLIIAFFIGVSYIGYRLYMQSTQSRDASASKLLGLLFLYFMVLTLFKGSFQRFSVTPLDGVGLNPQLQSILMFYHPLIVFAGYAFVVLAFALTLAGMETGTEQKLLGLSLKSGWLLLTVGIALGGLWAYQVLGWGGYWSWDPVETASLLPWLALTTYFHGASNGPRKDLFKELMVVLSFDSLLFLSALTRGGLLNSVHAYAFSPAGPALLVCIITATAYFFYLKNKLGKPLICWPSSQTPLQDKMMFASQLALMGIFWVCFAGVIIPTVQNLVTGVAASTSIEFYNYVSMPFILAFVVASLFCGASSKSIRLRLGALVATVVASLISLLFEFPSTFPVVNAVLPLLIVVALTAMIGVLTVIAKNRSIALIGRQIMHLGVIVMLFGVFVSSSMSPDPQSVTVGVSSTPGRALGVDLSVGNVTMELGSGSAYVSKIDMVTPEQSSMSVPLHATFAGRTYSGVLVGQYFPNYGLVANPTVLGDGVTDIYVNLKLDQAAYNSLFSALNNLNNPPAILTLQVSTKPLVNVIWWGSALMGLGIIMSIPSTFSEGKKKASKPIEENKRDGDDRDKD